MTVTLQDLSTALALCVVACASQPGSNPVSERKAYWEQAIRAEVPEGSSIESLKAWADGRSLKYDKEAGKTAFIIGLEYVPVASPVCNGYGVSLEALVNADGLVTKETVRTLGVCL